MSIKQRFLITAVLAATTLAASPGLAQQQRNSSKKQQPPQQQPPQQQPQKNDAPNGAQQQQRNQQQSASQSQNRNSDQSADSPKGGVQSVPNSSQESNRQSSRRSGNRRSGSQSQGGANQLPGSNRSSSGSSRNDGGLNPGSLQGPASGEQGNRRQGNGPGIRSGAASGNGEPSGRAGANNLPPSMPNVVAPTPGAVPPGNSTRSQRTALEVFGEEGFLSSGLPNEARTMPLDQALALGKRIVIQEHFELPKEATSGMTAEQLSEEVAKLQAFGAWDQIKSEEFWKNHNQHGFDVALGPHIRGNLGIPEGVHTDSPASKIMNEAGELQNFGLDLTNGAHWNLFGEFQAGNKSAQDLIDVANATSKWSGGTSGERTGPPNGRPGNHPGNSSSGNASEQPGNSSGDLPGKGPIGQQLPGDNSSGNGNQDNSTDSNSGVDMEGDTIEAVDPEVSYSAVVTHNDDGSFTVDIYQNDGTGNTTKVASETFSDPEGDGSFVGDQGNTVAEKPSEGNKPADYDADEGQHYYIENSSSESSSDSTDSDTTDSDTGTDDTETKPDDKYTPGPDGELYYNYEWMLSTYQRLSAEKYGAGKGGKDSTPNPMNESFGSGTVPWNPKDSVVRPVDGTSGSSATIPSDAIKQIQDPNAVQGGVIDPVKRKDQH